jgi:hypothetical protein
MKRILLLVVSLLLLLSGYAQPGGGQNNTCETAAPFCTGTQYAFPAGVNAGNGQPGPCYDCLINMPNPAWYYMKVASMGDFVIQLETEPARDVDFVCWGPFNSLNSCNNLVCSKVVSCDYGTTLIKTCSIPMSYTGQYYIIALSNFSNLPCNILFNQVGGTGTTDCSILPPPASSNSPLCLDQTIQLNAMSVLSGTYHWSGPNGFYSVSQNPTIPNAQLVNAGDYYLNVYINGVPQGDSIKTSVYLYHPEAHAGNDTVIQNGVFATLHGSASQGSGSYSYHWEPANLLVNPNVANPQTVNLYSATIYTLTITDDSASCQASDYVAINIAGGPLAVNGIALPSIVCAGTNSQLSAFGAGGTGVYTYHWTGPGGFSSNLQNPTVQPTVTTVYTIEVNDGFNSTTSTVTVNVLELPAANAGEDKSIPFGTYTFLDGSVDGGSSTYFYSWSPIGKLLNPNVQFPQTKNLTSTTVFSLVVTDLITNCVSDNQANVSINVTGGALNTNPVATPSWICPGDTTQLYASAGGGNEGFYQYTWASNPPGFTSSLENPYVNPTENTTFTVTVFDGFNTVEGATIVSIYPQPEIYLGPADTTICIYDSLTLDAGNPGADFLWSNGAINQAITVRAAGIVPESQSYNVKVTNSDECSSVSSINILFSYSACTGISKDYGVSDFVIYPNPSDGRIHLKTFPNSTLSEIAFSDILGITILNERLDSRNATGREYTFDLSSLPPGIYFARLSNRYGSKVQKIIIH